MTDMETKACIPIKAPPGDFRGRFREIVSDPLNFLIRRVPMAGLIEDDLVYLHSGIRVPVQGPAAYYSDFSDILVINRGVHEPLEEFVFQQLLDHLPQAPTMLELGAYWGHYSMWLKTARPNASVFLVESDPDNLEVGRLNLARNGIDGQLIHSFVGRGHFSVDQYLLTNSLTKLTILHSDIQGFEVEMIDGAVQSLRNGIVDYVLISSHSQELHMEVVRRLKEFGYRIEAEADFDSDTTSFDGFVFAVSPTVEPVFSDLSPLGRIQVVCSDPEALLSYVDHVKSAICPVLTPAPFMLNE